MPSPTRKVRWTSPCSARWRRAAPDAEAARISAEQVLRLEGNWTGGMAPGLFLSQVSSRQTIRLKIAVSVPEFRGRNAYATEHFGKFNEVTNRADHLTHDF